MKREELTLRKPFIDAWCGHVSRVEPAIGSSSGIPDTHMAEVGADGWVEFKVADEAGNFELEPSQRLWLRKYLPHRQNVAICAMDKEGFWLIPGMLVHKTGVENVYDLGGRKVRWSHLEERVGLLSVLLRKAWEQVDG